MNQNVQQPFTHSLLRSSQARRQSQSKGSENLPSNYNQSQNPRNSRDRYHYNYSKSIQPLQQTRKLSSTLNQSNIEHKQIPTQTHVVYSCKEKIVVCQSLPKTRPKYSFTFTNQSASKLQVQKKNSQAPCTSFNSHEQKNFCQQNDYQKPFSVNVRKDIDQCLYVIADRLKQIQEQQIQTKILIQSKMGQKDYPNSYKPSISQIRKNKKLCLDKSIHRIHPQIVNQYIETVYREYKIPDPLKSSQRKLLKLQQPVQISQFEVREKKQVSREKNMQYSKPDSQPNIDINKPQIFHSRYQQQPSKSFRQDYYLYSTKNPVRKNNLIIQNQRQTKQTMAIKGGRKKFLNLTLSKQKGLKPKTFQSPTKSQRQQKKQQSEKSRSQKSKDRQSNSQKKILEIKKNIATWNDSQHQFAQRYSYLESPYEMIRYHRTQQQPRQTMDSNRGQVNVKIRPFEELMRATAPTEAYEQMSVKGNNTTMVTQQSQFQESKYAQSFFTHEGEVMEEFRYCVLCELPVLSANIFKHEQKCIGWINQKSMRFTFKQLYKMQNEGEIKVLIKQKIAEINKRIIEKVDILKKKQIQDQNEPVELTRNILQSVEGFLDSFVKMTDFDSLNPQNCQLFNLAYKKIQKNYKNQYLELLEESRKLHWFVRLLENYQLRLNKSSVSKQARKQKQFTTTMGKVNQSLTFVGQQESQNKQPISEFFSLKEQ